MKQLDNSVKQALLAPFQVSEVGMRVVPFKAFFVSARVVMTRLDEVLPWQWTFKLMGLPRIDVNGVMHQDACLILKAPIYNDSGVLVAMQEIAEFNDRGQAPPDNSKQFKQGKHAASDALKRCAVHAGVGRYIYELGNATRDTITEEMLTKALSAVGYRGAHDNRHFGQLGGRRFLDDEDEIDEAITISPDDLKALRQEVSGLLKAKFSNESDSLQQVQQFLNNVIPEAGIKPVIGTLSPYQCRKVLSAIGEV